MGKVTTQRTTVFLRQDRFQPGILRIWSRPRRDEDQTRRQTRHAKSKPKKPHVVKNGNISDAALLQCDAFPERTLKRCLLACYELTAENLGFFFFFSISPKPTTVNGGPMRMLFLIKPALASPVVKTLEQSMHSCLWKENKSKGKKTH